VDYGKDGHRIILATHIDDFILASSNLALLEAFRDRQLDVFQTNRDSQCALAQIGGASGWILIGLLTLKHVVSTDDTGYTILMLDDGAIS
jgi:hypothetical protein